MVLGWKKPSRFICRAIVIKINNFYLFMKRGAQILHKLPSKFLSGKKNFRSGLQGGRKRPWYKMKRLICLWVGRAIKRRRENWDKEHAFWPYLPAVSNSTLASENRQQWWLLRQYRALTLKLCAAWVAWWINIKTANINVFITTWSDIAGNRRSTPSLPIKPWRRGQPESTPVDSACAYTGSDETKITGT